MCRSFIRIFTGTARRPFPTMNLVGDDAHIVPQAGVGIRPYSQFGE